MTGGLPKVRIEVETLGRDEMRVTTPDAPNFGRLVRNVQDLGLAVREAVGWALAPHRVSRNDAAEPATIARKMVERGIETLTCTGCRKPWQRYKRNGRKPAYCDTCHPVYLPHITRVPQEIAS